MYSAYRDREMRRPGSEREK